MVEADSYFSNPLHPHPQQLTFFGSRMEEGCGCLWERTLEMENDALGSHGERRLVAGSQGVGGVLEAENRYLISGGS